LPRGVGLVLAVVVAFAAYCVGHTVITGGTVDPLLSVTWAVTAVVPWAACWPALRRVALRARAEGVLPLSSIVGPLGLAAVASAVLERASALAFGVQHGATFAELVFRRLPVLVGFVLAARLHVRSLAGRDARPCPTRATPEETHDAASTGVEQEPRHAARTGAEEAIEITTGSGSSERRPGDIDWVKAAGNYLELHAGGRCDLVRGTLKGFAAAGGAGQFVRIHRSMLVNRERVAGLVRRPRGRLALRLQDGCTLAVGRSFRAEVERALG
jgi:DNA-binding LytR/AlgR family response regulator